MSDSMSFSMASLYGDVLLSGESSNTHQTIQKGVSFDEKGGESNVDEQTEELPPLRVETIYNMAFLQRPQTSIITHGETTNEDDSMRIDEEDESFITNERNGCAADIWIADDDSNGTSSPLKSPMNDGLALSKQTSIGVTKQKSPSKSRIKKSVGAVSCLEENVLSCIYVSSNGHLIHRKLSPSRPWISSGLFPQILVVRFQCEVRLNTISVEASGVLELSLVSKVPGEHQPTLQYRGDGSRETKVLELERSEVITNEVCLRAERGLDHFFVVHDIGITGVPVNWDAHW